MLEILAPAGDEQTAVAAVNSGADAVYLGLTSFSARSAATNLDMDALSRVIAYAHTLGAKIYVAMNTLVKQEQLEEFLKTLINVHNLGADAVILQDIFIGKYVHESYPEITLHLSTQAGTCNVYGAELAKKYGFSRVVLSRETPIAEIEKIASVIETEVFIQGALCTAFSGQCYFSSFVGKNSGNRGACKQPCRKKYAYNREGFTEPCYRLSLADLSVGQWIDRFIRAGVTSFKIEGRMRRTEYVSAAVGYYRELVDSHRDDAEKFRALKRTYNRGNYTKGLAFGQKRDLISDKIQGHLGERVGTVLLSGNKIYCKSGEAFQKGDAFKIVRNGNEVGGAAFLAAEKGRFLLQTGAKVKNGDEVYVTTDSGLQAKLNARQKTVAVKVSAILGENEYPRLTAICGNVTVETVGGEPCAPSVNSAITQEALIDCLKKTDKLPYEIKIDSINISGKVFMPKSKLNLLRRELYTKLNNSLTQNKNKQYQYINFQNYIQTKQSKIKNDNNINIPNFKNVIIVPDGKIAYYVMHNIVPNKANVSNCGTTTDITNNCLFVLKPQNYASSGIYDDYFNEIAALNDQYYATHNVRHSTCLYLPAFLSSAEIESLLPTIDRFDYLYIDGIYGIELAKKLNKPYIIGNGINIFNLIGCYENEDATIVLSKELTVNEAKNLQAEYSAPLFYQSLGSISLMQLLYCPFSRTCNSCDQREFYELTDEANRRFPVRRSVVCGRCSFEVYNCAVLLCGPTNLRRMIDLTAVPREKARLLLQHADDTAALLEIFPEHTSGHTKKPIL